ncbi:hypothetical protein MC885_012337 [Smutsia gigantea]|nr:hypothetical protein MC885_012337 [Smutsia gigantea]
MLSQRMISETIAVLTPSGINFPQTEKPKPASQRQDSLKKNLKAEIKVLGTIQIFCGVMVLSLGIILVLASFSPHFTEVFSSLLKAAYPFIGAFCFVISGSLSIITGKKTTKPLVHSSLAANLLSSLSALVGFILLSVNLAALGPALRKCDLTKEDTPEEQTYHFNSYDNVDCPIANAILAVRRFVCDAGLHSAGVLHRCARGCALVETSSLRLPGGECAGRSPWVLPGASQFPGCVELCQQEGQKDQIITGHEIHMGGGLISVIFLPQSYTYKSSMPPKADFDHGYEELLTS